VYEDYALFGKKPRDNVQILDTEYTLGAFFEVITSKTARCNILQNNKLQPRRKQNKT